MKIEIKLGQRVKDAVTSFEGTVTGICKYLTGCDQACVQTDVRKGETKTAWYDLNRLKVMEEPNKDVQKILDGQMQDGTDTEKTGGPQEHPPHC